MSEGHEEARPVLVRPVGIKSFSAAGTQLLAMTCCSLRNFPFETVHLT